MAYRCRKRSRRPDGQTGDLIAAARLREIARLKALSASGCAGVTRWRSALQAAVHDDLRATAAKLKPDQLPKWGTA